MNKQKRITPIERHIGDSSAPLEKRRAMLRMLMQDSSEEAQSAVESLGLVAPKDGPFEAMGMVHSGYRRACSFSRRSLAKSPSRDGRAWVHDAPG